MATKNASFTSHICHDIKSLSKNLDSHILEENN